MAESEQPRGGRFDERLTRRAEYVRALLDETEKRRREADSEGLNFTAPTPEQLEEKLRRSQSPWIYFQGWSGSAPRDGMLTYTVGITNPDPDAWIWLFAHVFVGLANLPRGVGDAVAAVDDRFPQLTEPAFAGLQIPAFGSDSLSYTIDIPANVAPSNYLGNTFLFQSTWHDPAVYLDRSLFVFGVT